MYLLKKLVYIIMSLATIYYDLDYIDCITVYITYTFLGSNKYSCSYSGGTLFHTDPIIVHSDVSDDIQTLYLY